MSPGLPTRLLATQSDERLLALARDGHERAFEALVLRYRRPLLRYCRRLALADCRVEDVLQQALLQAWMALARGAQVRDPRAWLYRIVHNTAVNALRDGAAHNGADLAEAPAQALASDPDLARGLVVRETLAEMAALPAMQREVMLRTAVGGHSHEEVASALGISDGAVRGLLYRARATMRTAVTALTPSPLLTWMIGAGQGAQVSGGLGELGGLAAGGGTAGLGGLLVKGGLAAVAVGTLIGTSATILPPHTSSPRGGSGERASATAGARAAARPGVWASAGGGGAGTEAAVLSAGSGRTGRRGFGRASMTAPARRQGAWSGHAGLPVNAPAGVRPGGRRHGASGEPSAGAAPGTGNGGSQLPGGGGAAPSGSPAGSGGAATGTAGGGSSGAPPATPPAQGEAPPGSPSGGPPPGSSGGGSSGGGTGGGSSGGGSGTGGSGGGGSGGGGSGTGDGSGTGESGGSGGSGTEGSTSTQGCVNVSLILVSVKTCVGAH
jgi:RNA polymerase sigma factor (sigma-70 family)